MKLRTSPPDPAIFGRSLGEQEQLIPIIRSILTDSRYIVSVNVPNTGIVPNLPSEAVLEVPGAATARGIRALSLPDFPSHLAGIIERRLAPIQTTVEAALKGDRGLFAEALILDGAVASRAKAEAMVDDFIVAQRKFLPRFT
jgi:alpha-galactosidase